MLLHNQQQHLSFSIENIHSLYSFSLYSIVYRAGRNSFVFFRKTFFWSLDDDCICGSFSTLIQSLAISTFDQVSPSCLSRSFSSPFRLQLKCLARSKHVDNIFSANVFLFSLLFMLPLKCTNIFLSAHVLREQFVFNWKKKLTKMQLKWNNSQACNIITLEK